jgi:hypothetical protein
MGLGQVGLLPLVAVLAATAGTLTHRPLVGAGVGVLLIVVLALASWRRRAPVPGPGGPGWPPGGGPGTAGVREPRRPHPSPPAGSLALRVPVVPNDDEVASLA